MRRAVALVVALLSAVSGAAGPGAAVSSDDVSFTTCAEANCSATTVRSLTAILFDRPSVKDFGAVGCVDEDSADASACPDDTAAFERSLKNTTGAVYVPKGRYRIDGTVTLGPGQHLIIDSGADLCRTNHTCSVACNVEPVVRLLQSARLTGPGAVSSRLASPRGIVNVGPPSLHTLYNVEFNHVSDVTVSGPGLSAHDPQGTVLNDRYNTSTGSIAICLDSAQHYVPTPGNKCHS